MVYAFCIGASVSVASSVVITHFIVISTLWKALIGILIYLTVNALVHLSFKLYCNPYISGPNPKHLIVISSGHLGHPSRCKGWKDSFEHYFKRSSIGNTEHIMVYLAKRNHNGFFFYTICKTNDGVDTGGLRLANEIKQILSEYPSIHKLSLIGCSLGGLYCRHAISLLFDSQTDTEPLIHGKPYELMNFITFATPHQGVKDWTSIRRFCCCPCTYYTLASFMNKLHLMPPTLQQLMFLDANKLLIRMATDDRYVCPLQLFQNKICFGNAKHDTKVHTSSALLLHGDEQLNDAEYVWNKMVERKDNNSVEELAINIADNEEKDEESYDEELKRLRSDIEWKKIVVCWNQNIIIKNTSHAMLAGPPFWYSGAKDLFQTLESNFVY